MSVYSNIEHNHHKILDLIADIESLGTKKTQLRKPLFTMLMQEVIILLKAEEKTFFAELEEHKQTRTLVAHLEEESETIEYKLKQTACEKCGSKQWYTHFTALTKLLRKHIEEEENKLFPKAHNVLDEHEEDVLEEKLDEAKRDMWGVHSMQASVSLKSNFSNSVKTALSV